MAVIEHVDHPWIARQRIIYCKPCDVELFKGFNPESKGQKAKETIAKIMDGTYLGDRLHLPEETN